jgi:hypothetical protein
MILLCGLSFLIFILTIGSGSSLICYQCDTIVITASNLTTPPGCIKTVVNKTYCTIGINFYGADKGDLTIQSETAHQAFGYNEEFVLLGLTINSDGSYGYGLIYHCLTDDCNQPKLSKLQLLWDSTTIDHNVNTIVPYLYTPTPEVSLTCSRYTNFTNPDTCYSKEPIGNLCLTCLASIDGITNSICAYCLENVQIISELLNDERAYLLKTRERNNHEFQIRCNIPWCNRMDNIQRIQQLHRYDFDIDKFNAQSKSSLLLYNKFIIPFFAIILFISNKF